MGQGQLLDARAFTDTYTYSRYFLLDEIRVHVMHGAGRLAHGRRKKSRGRRGRLGCAAGQCARSPHQELGKSVHVRSELHLQAEPASPTYVASSVFISRPYLPSAVNSRRSSLCTRRSVQTTTTNRCRLQVWERDHPLGCLAMVSTFVNQNYKLYEP